MALPATHIRFAATAADRLGVTDMGAYLSGTLYPDSRWVTGIDRRRTHAPRCLDPDFASDDFTLGWHMHCLCDRMQGDIHAELLEDLPELTPEARWVRTSAAKVVQDMTDAARGGIGGHLPLLTQARSPNGESGGRVAAYLGMVRRAYRKGTPDWSDYVRLWTDVGLDRLRVDRIRQQVRAIMVDEALVDALHGVFDRMAREWSDRRAATGHGRRPS
ncbi:MAG TPA: hypothetical protein VLT88_03310 [Desulfosarcina sp.]|nr:hypothetical protein [Desulfosarcina sp.]